MDIITQKRPLQMFPKEVPWWEERVNRCILYDTGQHSHFVLPLSKLITKRKSLPGYREPTRPQCSVVHWTLSAFSISSMEPIQVFNEKEISHSLPSPRSVKTKPKCVQAGKHVSLFCFWIPRCCWMSCLFHFLSCSFHNFKDQIHSQLIICIARTTTYTLN